MRRLAIIAVSALCLSNGGFANDAGLWFEGESSEQQIRLNAETVLSCLQHAAASETCVGIAMKPCLKLLGHSPCHYQEMEAWNFLGLQAYNSVSIKFPDARDELFKSQEAWYEYANKDCRLYSKTAFPEQSANASLEGRMLIQCLHTKTAERTIELRKMLAIQ